MSYSVDYRKLSIPERVRLVQDIWDTIVDEAPPETVPPWQHAELDRRLEELARSPDDVQNWDEGRAEIEAAGWLGRYWDLGQS